MASSITTIGTQCVANAAAVATALGGGVATADVTALGKILLASVWDMNMLIQIMKQCTPDDVRNILPQ